MKDLFEDYEKWPPFLAKIMDRYSLENADYRICAALLKEVEAVGYTFEYGLDAQPYDLHLKRGGKTLAIVDQNERVLLNCGNPTDHELVSFGYIFSTWANLIEVHGRLVSTNCEDVTEMEMVWLALPVKEGNIHIWRELRNDISLTLTQHNDTITD